MSKLQANDPGIASSLNVAHCIAPLTVSADAAISQWISDVILFTKLSTTIMTSTNEITVGQMLVAAMVGSTENYFRTLFADMVDACPYTASNVAQCNIPYAAVHTFERARIGYGLVEGSLFSSKGVIAQELGKFARYKVQGTSEVGKAIESFDSVCAIRHAAVHWSGRFDTRSHAALDADVQRRGQHGLALNLQVVQDALASCDFLVRTVNQTLFDLTVQRWLSTGYLGPDNIDRVNGERARALSRVFAEDRLKSSVAKRLRALCAGD